MERKHYYTDERNAQIVIALLKAHGVKDIVISPGATNDCFVLSVQDDPDFKLYSAVDERHAGYLACGIAQTSGRPVVINCTGATSSRNYMSALTEAYYRKLPVIALTSSQHSSHIGQMYPQMTDRIHLPADIVNLSVQCPIPHTKEEVWACELNVNRAILETKRHGGGPVHINLETGACGSYTTERLPDVTKILRIAATDENGWPDLSSEAKVAIWIGAHLPFSESDVLAFNQFVASHTQRYWECMATGTIIVGRAPRELLDLCGYNPVVTIGDDPVGQISRMLSDIDKGEYQDLANRNRKYVESHVDWAHRVRLIKDSL